MALVTNEQKEEREKTELIKAWGIIKTIPEYIRDYKLSIQADLEKSEQDRIAKTWGFFPLSNPEDDLTLDFQSAFSHYSDDASLFNSPIRWNGLEFCHTENEMLIDPEGNEVEGLKDIGTIFNLEVDLSKPVNVLVKKFSDDVKKFQKMLRIEPKNSKSHDHREYLANCLRKAGLKDKDIKQRLGSKHRVNKDEIEKFKASDAEAVRRRLKKHGKV